MEKMKCKYEMFVPDVGICCNAYFKSVREDGKGWTHFPICTEKNCPLIHSELLEGAILESEDDNETLDR